MKIPEKEIVTEVSKELNIEKKQMEQKSSTNDLSSQSFLQNPDSKMANSLLKNAADLFKTIRGTSKLDEPPINQNTEKTSIFSNFDFNKKSDPGTQISTPSMKSTPFFGKQPEAEGTKALEVPELTKEDSKSEAKPLFSGTVGTMSTGLFSNMVRKTNQQEEEKEESKKEISNKSDGLGGGGFLLKSSSPMNSTPIASKPLFGDSILGKTNLDNKEENEKNPKSLSLFGNSNLSKLPAINNEETQKKTEPSPFSGFKTFSNDPKPPGSLFNNADNKPTSDAKNLNETKTNGDSDQEKKSIFSNNGGGLFGKSSNIGSGGLFKNQGDSSLFETKKTGLFSNFSNEKK